MMTGTNKAHRDSKEKKKLEKNMLNIIIMKQNKAKHDLYSYKYDNIINIMYLGIML